MICIAVVSVDERSKSISECLFRRISAGTPAFECIEWKYHLSRSRISVLEMYTSRVFLFKYSNRYFKIALDVECRLPINSFVSADHSWIRRTTTANETIKMENVFVFTSIACAIHNCRPTEHIYI